MGKKGKKGQAGKPKKLTPKDVGKRLNALAKNLEEELKGADLFSPLPPTEDCAICLVPLSRLNSETFYQACCGNVICWACYNQNEVAIEKQNEEKAGKKAALTCPFCREPEPTSDEEYLCRLQARCLKNDHNALALMGDFYRTGDDEAPKDDLKAFDCWIQAVELGSAAACGCIANCYNKGDGVAVNKERAALFKRVGAQRGCVVARHNIGTHEYYDLHNHEIGIRHWKISAEAGDQDSLDALKNIYNANGKRPGKEFISKDCMDSLYRVCHDAQEEVKSEEREKHCNGGVDKEFQRILKALQSYSCSV
jgi:hypothetical protein